MNTIGKLFADMDYVASLLNGPCRPCCGQHHCEPIRREWIDETASREVTEALGRLLPGGIPYMCRVIVEKNPDMNYGGVCVDSNEKRQRYFMVTVIPDTVFPYNSNYPLIHSMRSVALHCWEVIRATLAACTKDMLVLISKAPEPPILNNARIEWVSLYLGRKPYTGLARLSKQWKDPAEYDGHEDDVCLYKLREMDPDPLLQRLIEAYDSEYPEDVHGDGENEPCGGSPFILEEDPDDPAPAT